MRSTVRWSIGVVSLVFAVTAVGLIDTGRPLAAQPAKRASGTELVPAEGFAVLSVNAAKLHDDPTARPIRDALEKNDKGMLKRIEADFGLPLDQVDRLTFYWPQPGYEVSPQSAAVFVTTRKPFDKGQFLKAWRASPEPRGNGLMGQFGFGVGGNIGFAGRGFGAGLNGVNLGFGGAFAVPQVVPAPPGGADSAVPVKGVDAKAEAKPKGLDLNAPLYYCGTYDETVVIPVDDTTVVVLPTAAATPAFVAGLLRRKADGPLAEVLALAAKHDVAFGLTGAGLRRQIKLYREMGAVVEVVPAFDGPGVPPPGKPNDPDMPPKVEDPFTPYEPLAELDRAVLTFDLGPTCTVSVVAHYPTADAAKKAEPVAEKGLAALAELLGEWRKATAEDPAEKDWLPLLDFARAGLKAAKVGVDGKTLTATAAAAVAPELKAAFAALPAKIQEAADRMKLSNHLQQIGLALLNYEAANGRLPRDVVDGEGKVLLSWRVELLPYLDANELYQKIDRTKAWDDPANKKLWDEMPDVFRVPARPTKEPHETYFQAFRTVNWVGTNDPWQVDTHNVTQAEVSDGTALTAAVFEMAEAAHWMKPGGPLFDPKKLPAVGNPATGKAGVVMLDGSVRTLDAKKYTGEKLVALITINGGEEVDENDFK